MSQSPVSRRAGLAALGIAAASVLSACASAPARVEAARNEDGVIVAARPIVIADAALLPEPPPIASFAASRAAAGAATMPVPAPVVRVAVIADAVGRGETQRGVSYTVRRDRDGTLVEIGQPELQALAPGTRVHLTYTDRVRITPAS